MTECLGYTILNNGDAVLELYDPETGKFTDEVIRGYMWPINYVPTEPEPQPDSDEGGTDEFPF